MTHEQQRMSGSVSVVIPAHNEAANLARCLVALGDQREALEMRVIVVANGCSDETAKIARGFPWVTVIELEQASKTAALNAGDEAAGSGPRIYLDADVMIDREGLSDVVQRISTSEPLICSPRVEYQLGSCSRTVRSFYRVHSMLPSAKDGIAGHGVYAVSAAGRRRFTEFPDVHADDYYVTRLFSPQERARATGSVQVWPPRDLRSLIAVRTRILRGNKATASAYADAQDSHGETTSQTLKALLRHVARQPWNAPAVGVYVGVTIAARVLARRSAAANSWNSDLSTRAGV